VVDRLKPQFDAVASYAKEDPARAALGVATAGAVLFGLMALIRRSGS
jgi:diacylglycerol kinase